MGELQDDGSSYFDLTYKPESNYHKRVDHKKETLEGDELIQQNK